MDSYRTEWTDKRCDDLALLVHANDKRLDETCDRVNDHDNWITSIVKTGDRRSDRNWTITLTLITVTLAALGNIVVTLIHH